MFYDYTCHECGFNCIDEHFERIGDVHPERCPQCGSVLRRQVASMHIVRGMTWDFQPHFNNSVGAPVSSMREFRNKLKEVSTRQSEATGMAHDFLPVDPRDRAVFGVTSEHLEVNVAVEHGARSVQLDKVLRDKVLKESNASWGEAPPLEGEKS